MYREELRNLLRPCVWGVVGGVVFVLFAMVSIMGEHGIWEGFKEGITALIFLPILMGYMMGGLVYFWKLTGRILGGTRVLLPVYLFIQLARLMFGWIVGWLPFTFKLVMTLLRMKKTRV